MNFLAIWYLTGMCGATLIFRSNALFEADLYRHAPAWCPTPRGIVLCAAASITGPWLLITGVLITISDWAEKRPKRESWFTRPICRRQK